MENRSLEELRIELDEADSLLLHAFEDRMRIASAIATLKRKEGMPVLDTAREAKVIESRTAMAEEAIRPFVGALWRELMALSREYQERLISEGSECGTR